MQANGYITRQRTAAVVDDGSGSVWQHGESAVSGPLLFVLPSFRVPNVYAWLTMFLGVRQTTIG